MSDNERIRCNYDAKQQEVIELDKQIILFQIKKSQKTGTSPIFENQERIASNIVNAFMNRKIINIMVVSETQSGKTGSMVSVIKQYLEEGCNSIPIENIYIITGLSSCEWKEQTKERMPESIQNRVFHRCDLPITFVDEIKDKHNCFIIMDEIQIAAKKDQTIFNAFKDAGLLDTSKLYENDIKILEYTATPDGTIYDLMKWGESSIKILAEPGEGYISSYNLLKMGRVKQYKDLCGYDKKTKKVNKQVVDNIKEIKIDIDTYSTKLYHIFRTKTGKEQNITIKNFKEIFNTCEFEFKTYDGESDIIDINNTLTKEPEKHTFIFIKEMLRCSKTIHKKYIGITYDRYSKNPDDSVIIQGLIGRMTGYDDNYISICYTNIYSIDKYEKLWNSNFEDKTIEWKSKTTKFIKDILSGNNTFNNIEHYDRCSVSNDKNNKLKEPVIKEFITQEEVKNYYNKELKEKLKGRGPNKRKSNDDGFYEATVYGNTKIYSYDEIIQTKRQGLTDKNYRLYPCYRNKNEKSTLVWLLIHY